MNERGSDRAKALLRLFPGVFPAPDFIFATMATANSNRPVETVTPLAKSLGMQVRSSFANDEFPALAREILHGAYAGKTVLVCWHRGKIPGFAAALGVTGKLPDWNEQQYDRVWRLDFAPTGEVNLKNSPQNLLRGDSAN